MDREGAVEVGGEMRIRMRGGGGLAILTVGVGGWMTARCCVVWDGGLRRVC